MAMHQSTLPLGHPSVNEASSATARAFAPDHCSIPCLRPASLDSGSSQPCAMCPMPSHQGRPYVPRHRSLEDRRSRGEVACAECRRLKLKCDRIIPCSSCIKRDCAGLCPNGSVVTKDTTRAVIAASQHMHDDIARLRRRARALESALGSLHHERVGFPHPLLSEDDDFGDDEDDSVDPMDGMVSTIATLHLSDSDGMERFFGNVQLPHGATNPADQGELAQLPPILDRCIRFFPLSAPADTREHAVAALWRILPERTYVEQVLHGVFEDHVFWIAAVDDTLIFDLLPGLYDLNLALAPCARSGEEGGSSPRAFALLYALLAIAALLDAEDPAREEHATIYSRLSLAGLGAVSVFDKPSYMSVLALLVLSVYHMLRQKELGETSRLLNNLAFQGAIQIGLFIDSSHWDMPWMTVQRRRRLFWTLFQVNIWESLGTGRPPVIYEPTLINCLFQLDPNTEPTPEHSKPSSDAHGFEVTRDLTARVVVATSMIEPPHYQEILALDASIRARWMPSSVVNSYLDVKIGAPKRLVICAPYRPLLLMSLHRGHFVRAVEDSPLNPTGGTYNPSFRAAVSGAWEVLEWIPKFFEADPGRAVYVLPHSWTWSLTAAVVLYTVIEKAPHSDCVDTVLAQLEKVRDTFAAAKDLGGGRAASGLPMLERLCASSRAIISSRNSRIHHVAWSVELNDAWSRPDTPQQPASARATPPSSTNQFCWLDDDVSDSFKSLFKNHYRDAQQYNVPGTAPSPTALPTVLPRRTEFYSYPGYLQYPSASARLTRARELTPTHIDLSGPLPDMPQLMPDSQLPADPGSLANIWLAHSRQLGVLFPVRKASATNSQDTDFGSQLPNYMEWF